ncbi:anti-anti-sigma factor [Anaerobacillus alkalidiazotrophicus]|uniref:Anti-sigma factor antagonist n=1 Tax=Anaerobacillus alkalidiazotrophicus TaxID=472963 RepID=A0A1S2MAC6_9BACI|nr:STAS domain-containing protein [Anaerobacillus alkalidiazotrophicus]OIJ21534.1 anti-anti-sigma factor [Anaerobacillus alkalidiazotrophicus]
MNLEIIQIEKVGKQYLILNGEVDVYTAKKLNETLLHLTEVEGNEIIIDLSQVNYIDSIGLGTFIGALKSSHKHDSSIKLIGMTERVRRLFHITGLDEVMNIDESMREEEK